MKLLQRFACLSSALLLMLMVFQGCRQQRECVENTELVTECHSNPGYYWDYENCQCVQD